MKLSQFAGPVRAQSFWLTVFCIENIVVYLRLLFHSLPSRQEILRNDALGCHQSVCVQFNGCPPVTLAFADSELLSLLEGQFLVRASLEPWKGHSAVYISPSGSDADELGGICLVVFAGFSTSVLDDVKNLSQNAPKPGHEQHPFLYISFENESMTTTGSGMMRRGSWVLHRQVSKLEWESWEEHRQVVSQNKSRQPGQHDSACIQECCEAFETRPGRYETPQRATKQIMQICCSSRANLVLCSAYMKQ